MLHFEWRKGRESFNLKKAAFGICFCGSWRLPLRNLQCIAGVWQSEVARKYCILAGGAIFSAAAADGPSLLCLGTLIFHLCLQSCALWWLHPSTLTSSGDSARRLNLGLLLSLPSFFCQFSGTKVFPQDVNTSVSLSREAQASSYPTSLYIIHLQFLKMLY